MKSLSNLLVEKLKKKRFTISVAESCTGGLLSSNITSIPNVSKVFLLGLVTYSNHSKIKLLKIPRKIIEKYGAVSKEICIKMVKNLNKIAKTDVSISITGIAGPAGGTKGKPVGLAYIGIKTKNKLICKKFLIKKNRRNQIQKEITKKAIKLTFNLLN